MKREWSEIQALPIKLVGYNHDSGVTMVDDKFYLGAESLEVTLEIGGVELRFAAHSQDVLRAVDVLEGTSEALMSDPMGEAAAVRELS